MKKNKIVKMLRENADNSKVVNEVDPKRASKVKGSDDSDKKADEDKILKLLGNDVINHAAIVRKMTGSEWTDNSEATNRSKFRKKLNKLTNDEGSTYSFDDDEISQIEKVLMNLSSSITNTIGRQGK